MGGPFEGSPLGVPLLRGPFGDAPFWGTPFEGALLRGPLGGAPFEGPPLGVPPLREPFKRVPFEGNTSNPASADRSLIVRAPPMPPTPIVTGNLRVFVIFYFLIFGFLIYL